VRTLVLAIAALLLVACGSDGSSPVVTSALGPSALASAVDIRAAGCRPEEVRGAGAMIEGGYVLTAAHVVAGADSIAVRPARPPDSSPLPGRVVALDPVNDLALLGVPGLDLAPLALGTATSGTDGVAVVFRDGEPVAVRLQITRPVIIRILDIYHGRKVSRPGYEVAAQISAGDSGAVAVTSAGTAVGVLYAKSREADDRAWATDTSAVAPLLEAAESVDPGRGIDTGKCAG
jgi:S1-C subfamily serine protease